MTASEDNTAQVWDAATGEPIGKPLQHEWSHSRPDARDGEMWRSNGPIYVGEAFELAAPAG